MLWTQSFNNSKWKNRRGIHMKNNLKCPFCGAELEKEQGSERWWYCVNAKCVHKYTTTHETIWQALIDGKAAQDALDKCQSFIGELVRYHLEPGTPENKKGNELLKGIASITTQEKE